MTVFSALIFTGSDSKRMKSEKAKEVHKICGREMINHVLDTAFASGAECARIIAPEKAGEIADAVLDRAECIFLSDTDASANIKAFLETTENVIVLFGDMPLITAKTLKDAMKEHLGKNNEVTVIGNGLNADVNNYILKAEKLLTFTDVSGDTVTEKIRDITKNSANFGIYNVDDADELMRINDRIELAAAAKVMQRRINTNLMLEGVTIIDPDNTFICKDAVIGIDTVIYPGTVIEGKTVIGKNVYIGPNCRLINATIGDGSDVNISTIVESSVGSNTHVGPYAYIRPGCNVGSGCKVGDFVELKKAQIGDGTKLSHLTYVGDAEVGCNVNFGCGTVVVNYDGKNKYKTVIKDNAFIGCNSNLVSPVTVNEGAYIAAGSTITDEVPQNTLAIARARQVIKENWQDRRKK